MAKVYGKVIINAHVTAAILAGTVKFLIECAIETEDGSAGLGKLHRCICVIETIRCGWFHKKGAALG